MKLSNKFTLWYFGIMLVVLLTGGAIVYNELQWKINKVEVVRHERLNDLIAAQIRSGGDYRNHPTRKRATIAEIPADSVPRGLQTFYTRGTEWNPEFQVNEYRLEVTSFYAIGPKHFRVTTYSYIPSFYQILPGVVDSFKWIFLLLLVLVGVSGRLIPKYILAPFKRTLRVIQGFDLKQREAIRLPPTRTSEFRELNMFLRKMTDKALEDYQSLKEFAENASHELQTPTAIIRGKLDLLMESEIRDEQALLIADMQNELEKLSRIHSSLTLLTKLENKEFEAVLPVCISQLAREALNSFGELIQMKSLKLNSQIEEGVYIPLHPSLVDLLLTNLISNAIRHNIPGGEIHVKLNREGLAITNTGRKPVIPVSELFERFKKGDPASDSIGIGLAIVRQICELMNFSILYEYGSGSTYPPEENPAGVGPLSGLHAVAISFRPQVAASNLLQIPAVNLHHVKNGF